jgi:hypothetical protein
MLKRIFILIGVLSTGFIASCSLFLGYSAVNDAPHNKALAEAITRDLARGWDVSDLRPHFVTAAAEQVNFSQAQTAFNALRPLGGLKSVDQAQQTQFYLDAKVSEGLTKTATVAMVAVFENGRANVTMELKSEAGQMKLWHVNVTPIGGAPAKGEKA